MNTAPVNTNTGKQSPRIGGSPRGQQTKNSPGTESPKQLTPKADQGIASTSPRETGTSPAKSPRQIDQPKPAIEVSSGPSGLAPPVVAKETPKSPRLQDMFKAPDSPKTSSEPNVPRPQEPQVDKMEEEDEEMLKQIGSKQLGKVMVSIHAEN
jgi:hypothetical protein